MKNGPPTVSIVMPSRNQARFLRAALDSVLEQSFADLELIVIDGASTDDSIGVLREYAARDSRLRWSSGSDAGPAQAVNRGMGQARGHLVGWLNADDVYAPGAIACAVNFFRENTQAAMVYGHAEFIASEGHSLGRYPTKDPSTSAAAFADGCFICQPTVVMTRGAWNNSGGLNESLQTSFDFDLWIRLFKQNQSRIGFLDRVQAFSRRHDATITSKHRRQVALEALTILRQHLDSTPVHWILTHLDEIMENHPDDSGQNLREKIADLMPEVRNLMKEGDFLELEQRIAADRRIALAGRHSFIAVHPDGWAGPALTARIDTRRLRGLKITGRSGLPTRSKHRLSMSAAKEPLSSLQVLGQQKFEAFLEPRANGTRGTHAVQVTSSKVFRPSETEPGSADGRELSVIVECSEELS
jgi:hypothetical protein